MAARQEVIEDESRVKNAKAPCWMNGGRLGTWRANDRQQRPVPQNDRVGRFCGGAPTNWAVKAALESAEAATNLSALIVLPSMVDGVACAVTTI